MSETEQRSGSGSSSDVSEDQDELFYNTRSEEGFIEDNDAERGQARHDIGTRRHRDGSDVSESRLRANVEGSPPNRPVRVSAEVHRSRRDDHGMPLLSPISGNFEIAPKDHHRGALPDDAMPSVTDNQRTVERLRPAPPSNRDVHRSEPRIHDEPFIRTDPPLPVDDRNAAGRRERPSSTPLTNVPSQELYSGETRNERGRFRHTVS